MQLPVKKRLSKADIRLFKDRIVNAVMHGEPVDYEIFISRKRGTLLQQEFSEVDLKTKEIHINADKPLAEMVSSFVHEYLHILYPKRREYSVGRLEEHIMAEMSQGEKELIFKMVSQRAIFDE